MSTLTDKINSARYIYSANTKWGLKKFVCDIKYFTEEPLDDLYFVICSILNTNGGGSFDKHSLGILLGFSVSDLELEGAYETYYDRAEEKILEDILIKTESEHLIRIKDDYIFLTELGRISIQEKKHYHFFAGTQDVYEHTLKSEYPTAMLMFPFFKDMGISTKIQNSRQIWPEDAEMEKIIFSQPDQLKKRLEFHSQCAENIYEAELQQYFDLEVKTIPVNLYLYNEEYIPAIMNGESLAVRATELICEKVNSAKRENVVLECLFQKLWDDKSAILDYQSLMPFLELVDYEELTKDCRTVWSDTSLFIHIVDNANPSCWRNISRNCDIDVIRQHISEYKDFYDWPILTERIDDNFLIENFLEYPWDLEVLSEDGKRNGEVIEKLILQQKESEDDWNWEELENKLSQSFVLSHLELVKVDLASYTNDSDEVKKAILNNPDKRWDWNKIENEFELQFINDNILTIGFHFNFINLFERVFTDPEWADTFVTNPSFKKVVKVTSTEDGALSSAIFNDRNYIWSNELIDFLAENGLLCWPSSPYMIGFECNPYLKWTKSFFNRYSGKIITQNGKSFVSSQIKDVSILFEAPSFDWDWNVISANTELLSKIDLYKSFGTKLKWDIVFANQKDCDFLQSIPEINNLIGENQLAWASFSALADIDYVIKTYKDSNYPWNWSVLTERLFVSNKIKLENIGNLLFIDKWDWTFLSSHVDYDYLVSNLEKFSKYWNWEIILPRLLSEDKKFDYGFLDKLAVILTNINGNDKCKSAWSTLTSLYSFKELKRIIKETYRNPAYWWDMSYFCQNKEFYVFRDLEECRSYMDWDILSSSSAVDNSFKFNPKLGIKERAWNDDIRRILADNNNHWNFKLLSHFESLKDERWFITRYANLIDWSFISLESKVFCERDKQKLNEIIEAYKKYLDFKLLSKRDDVDIEQIIKIKPNEDYDFNDLIERKVINITLSLIEERSNYEWNWQLVSSSPYFVPTAQFLLSHLDCDFDWKFLSSLDNQSAWKSEKLILAVSEKEAVCEMINWYKLSSFNYFPLSRMILENVPLEKLNWKYLSGRDDIAPYIDDFLIYFDWKILSNNEVIALKPDVLEKYKEHLNWSIICKREKFIFSNEMVDKFSEYIDWNLASASRYIKFTKSFVDKYKDKWNWPELVKNKAFNNIFNMAEMPYAKQTNIVSFISKFPVKPKAYHFTHMENAVKIIRSMKLQCRNKADGNFSNSAGLNVDRTTKAHGFARFYFMPKSPTQFYNECLGKDKEDYKYYQKAKNLGLPKCPLPVFFVFDVEELLSVMPDICYYSNGNMQKDSSKWFKIIEEPNRIKAKEIYIDNFDTFEERQQEFLVDDELDFSNLKFVQICCYDSYQANMLKKELKGTKWEDAIIVGQNLYERRNKELYFYEKDDTIEIQTDYKNPYEFRISYSGTDMPTIINKQNVIRQRGNNIYVSSFIEVKKDSSFDVYFEVNEPKNRSWLIYKNL